MRTSIYNCHLQYTPPPPLHPPRAPPTESPVNSTQYESTLAYNCVEGYESDSSGINVTCNADGLWSDNPPICTLVKCTQLPKVANARLDTSVTEYRFIIPT